MKPPVIPEIPINQPLSLAQVGTWQATQHVFDEDSAWALKTALAANRPLLLRGEPGTGKSQLARAAAQVLGRQFVTEVVNARSEAQDLQWHFDAVARLGEAQAKNAGSDLAYARYITPGALWWVFNWDSANEQNTQALHPGPVPISPKSWKPEQGSVLLLDEIDKADSELPNALLEALGNGGFSVPHLHQCVGIHQQDSDEKKIPAPLVIITTNEERELPAAFIRRCLVLHLKLPVEEDALLAWLLARGRVHYPNNKKHDEAVLLKAAKLLWKDRRAALDQSLPPPGQAEYLDLLRAVFNLANTAKEQLALLDTIAGFALRKHEG